jgi:hypothetical protein
MFGGLTIENKVLFSAAFNLLTTENRLFLTLIFDSQVSPKIAYFLPHLAA